MKRKECYHLAVCFCFCFSFTFFSPRQPANSTYICILAEGVNLLSTTCRIDNRQFVHSVRLWLEAECPYLRAKNYLLCRYQRFKENIINSIYYVEDELARSTRSDYFYSLLKCRKKIEIPSGVTMSNYRFPSPVFDCLYYIRNGNK